MVGACDAKGSCSVVIETRARRNRVASGLGGDGRQSQALAFLMHRTASPLITCVWLFLLSRAERHSRWRIGLHDRAEV